MSMFTLRFNFIRKCSLFYSSKKLMDLLLMFLRKQDKLAVFYAVARAQRLW
jgi:hypothetical protein